VKGAQEVFFGAVLIFFVTFLRGGIVSVLRQRIRGWDEPLHGTRTAEAKPAPQVRFDEKESLP
jgi:branched-chain amino acid transport system permease protein